MKAQLNPATQLKIAALMLAAIKRTDMHLMYDPKEGDDGALCIDTTVYIAPSETDHSSILGTTKVPSWLVYTFDTCGGSYWEPPDVDMVELANVRSFDEAMLAAIEVIIRNECENRPFTAEEMMDFETERALEEHA